MKQAYCTDCGKDLGQTKKTKCDEHRAADRKRYQRNYHKARAIATAALIADHRVEFEQILARHRHRLGSRP